MGKDDKKPPSPTAETADAAFLTTVIDLAERTASSLRGQEAISAEMVRTTTHCMDERKESEQLTQARVDTLIGAQSEYKDMMEKRLKALEKRIQRVCDLAPRQPKWLWCFRELVTLVEKKPLATIVTILVLLLSAVVLAELGWNVTDWIQPPSGG
tara:strand:+ start:767 stop:1231 length:465 start_codon:yes stop_codon:yes gene_type:complete